MAPGIPSIRTYEAFDRAKCLSALRGEAIPSDLNSELARCSLIRGIRRYYGFATSEKVAELCSRYPELARARNARLIMSNEIPETLDDPPYCIWYPDLASEDTYRELARRYPGLRYNVGRACAVAGYANLYLELNLLPDVSIAEEARESKAEGSKTIYRTIMAASARYAVMNDAKRFVNFYNPTTPAYLNGNTAVWWRVDSRSYLPDRTYSKWGPDFVETDIEEDQKLIDDYVEQDPVENDEGYEGEDDTDDDDANMEYMSIEESTLLYTPLPLDLPTMRKDVLIQMAAHEGNIDRYSRLMRPNYMTDLEFLAVIRGIYHHTMFARWWADQVENNQERLQTPKRPQDRVIHYICQAINARRIMINEISTFTCDNDIKHPPFLIWWPLQPKEYTLLRLMERCPSMKYEIAIASIKCDYESLYKKLQPRPNPHLMQAAQQSHNPFYVQDLKERAAALDIRYEEDAHGYGMMDKDADTIELNMEPTDDTGYHPLHPGLMENNYEGYGPYVGDRADPSIVELYVWQEPELLRKFERTYGPGPWDVELGPTVESDKEDDDSESEGEDEQEDATSND